MSGVTAARAALSDAGGCVFGVRMGNWDRDLKVVSQLRPLDLLGLLREGPRDGRTTVRFLDKELASAAPLPRALDMFLEVRSPEGAKELSQLEFEAHPSADTAERVHAHWAYAQLIRREPIRTVVFYLRNDEGRRVQRRYKVVRGGTRMAFDFETVCLWEVPVDQMLERSAPGLWALSPLGRGARREHVQQAYRQIEALADERLSTELVGVWYEVAGTRCSVADLETMVRRKELLVESSTYKAIMEKGRQEGRQEGTTLTLRQTCVTLLETRLGELPAEAQVLNRISDPEQLQQLTNELIRAADADALLAALRAAAK